MGQTALSVAVKINRLDMVQYLLDHGKATPDLIDRNNNMTPLMFGIMLQNVEIVLQLLLHGANPEMCDLHCVTPIMLACHTGNTLMVKTLCTMAVRLNIDAQDENGWTALHYAVYANAPEIISFLLNTWGANRNIRDYKRAKPIQLAMIKKYGLCVACLEDMKTKMAMATGEMDED